MVVCDRVKRNLGLHTPWVRLVWWKRACFWSMIEHVHGPPPATKAKGADWPRVILFTLLKVEEVPYTFKLAKLKL